MTHQNFDGMTTREKAAHMTTGKLTIGTITQIEDGEFVQYYVARSRGLVLSIDDDWKFKTPEEARAYGRRCLELWRQKWLV